MPTPIRTPGERELTFSDFSAGIVQRVGEPNGSTDTSPAPHGAASVANTYNCIALPGGGLGPLPRRTTALRISGVTAGYSYAVTGFFVFGPLYSSANTVFFPPFATTTPFEAHVAFEGVNAGVQNHQWRRYRYYLDNNNDVLKNINLAGPSNKFAPVYFTSARSNPAAPLVQGLPVVAASWMPVEDSAAPNAGYTSVFPDPTAPTVTGVGAVPVVTSGKVYGHQSRLVTLQRNARPHGANNTYMPTDEILGYTAVNDSSTSEGSAVVIGQEFPNGYGVAGSITASDFILIKHYGGAWLIQGDLNSPTVRRFPGVVGTSGAECLGASTPIGFIYLVNNGGVYAWQGGDGSKLLSPQLEDSFWDAGALTYLFKGGFASWGDWVLAPNNFLLDTITGGWWRIEDPNQYKFFMWAKDPINNVMYGARPTFSSVDDSYAWAFDKTSPSLSFSWQSQPFHMATRRSSTIKQVTFVAQGAGSVTVSVATDGSIDAAPNAVVTSGTSPKRYVVDCNIVGTEFTLRIFSAGSGGLVPAPIVYEVTLIYEDGASLSV